jgi:D-sedoheptulose 7-phosphate isomerase
MSHVEEFLAQTARIAQSLDKAAIEALVSELVSVRESGGRLFVLGVGGSAANASHAVNDFRKLCAIDAYAPTDNVAELTARINDEGWESSFSAWLEVSRVSARDLVLVLSVGGGDRDRNVSLNLVRALELCQKRGARIGGIVGRDGGFTKSVAHACVVIPPLSAALVTAHTEAFQAVVWHLCVSDPRLQKNPMKWESLTEDGV